VSSSDKRLWLARLLIAAVIAWNLQATFIFLMHPAYYAPAFELNGVPGETALRGMAVLFVMWNIPYLVACWHPKRHRLSLWEALAMQVIGVMGESIILLILPADHPLLAGSLLRFIIFDTIGMVFLGSALWLI
jgi:hypothetical protein